MLQEIAMLHQMRMYSMTLCTGAEVVQERAMQNRMILHARLCRGGEGAGGKKVGSVAVHYCRRPPPSQHTLATLASKQEFGAEFGAEFSRHILIILKRP